MRKPKVSIGTLRNAFIFLDRKAQKELQFLNTPARVLFDMLCADRPIPHFYYAE